MTNIAQSLIGDLERITVANPGGGGGSGGSPHPSRY